MSATPSPIDGGATATDRHRSAGSALGAQRVPLPSAVRARGATRDSTRPERGGMGKAFAVTVPPIEALYQTHGPAVLRRARQILGNDAEALEVLHDVFAFLLEHPEQFAGRSSIMTYLYTITTHQALGRLRKERRRQHLLERNHDPDADLVAATALARAELRQLLTQLPEELATVAIYHHLDGMTHDEIAALMGCSRQWDTKLLARLRTPAEPAR